MAKALGDFPLRGSPKPRLRLSTQTQNTWILPTTTSSQHTPLSAHHTLPSNSANIRTWPSRSFIFLSLLQCPESQKFHSFLTSSLFLTSYNQNISQVAETRTKSFSSCLESYWGYSDLPLVPLMHGAEGWNSGHPLSVSEKWKEYTSQKQSTHEHNRSTCLGWTGAN